MKSLFTFAVALMLGLGFTAMARADDETKPDSTPPGKGKKMDLEALFKKLNTTGDGKLTREQFFKLGEQLKGKAAERFKGNAKAMDKMFNNLDTDGDGTLSLEEFKKFGQNRKKKDSQ